MGERGCMTLGDALAFAARAHDGQTDKAGQPYIRHVMRVVETVAGQGEDAMIVAALHDVFEDTGATLADLAEGLPPTTPIWARKWSVRDRAGAPHGFLPFVQGRALESLTRNQGEAYDDYLWRVRIDPLAATVKLADLRDNLARITELGDEGRSLAKRYRKAQQTLAGDALRAAMEAA
jgi:(p)ppGpp synthase/HD superfamily hydrolase